MRIQMTEEMTYLAVKAYRFESTLADVNARITFLAGFVGVKLDTDGEIQHILNRDNPAFRQEANRHPGHLDGHDSRVAHRAWEELRGLMVLRCTLVTQAVEVLGLGLTHQITSNVEWHLEQKGIKPGADGFDLHLQMDQIMGSLSAPAHVDVVERTITPFVLSNTVQPT